MWISEQRAIISLYSFNLSVFKTEEECLLRGTSWVIISDRYSFVLKGLMKPEFSGRTFENYSNYKINANLLCGSRVVPCGQTDGWIDITMLIGTFGNFVNAPEICFQFKKK